MAEGGLGKEMETKPERDLSLVLEDGEFRKRLTRFTSFGLIVDENFIDQQQ